ncbi:MAG: hypothetical protein ACRDA7_01345 [Metamycoplasmataceae bacterium]
MNNSSNNEIENYENLYNELNIIINQQSILSQKVGILLAINTLCISILIGLSIYTKCYWSLFLLLPFSISLILNLLILFPKLSIKNKKNENSENEYWKNYSELDIEEIEDLCNNKKRILNQIKINSQILTSKYKIFLHSLSINFCGFPYFFLIHRKCKKDTTKTKTKKDKETETKEN